MLQQKGDSNIGCLQGRRVVKEGGEGQGIMRSRGCVGVWRVGVFGCSGELGLTEFMGCMSSRGRGSGAFAFHSLLYADEMVWCSFLYGDTMVWYGLV